MRRIVGLGAGGHAKVVLEALRLMSHEYEIVGLLDPKEALWGTDVLGTPVLGDDGLLPGLRAQGIECAFVGLGGTGDNGPRQRLYEKAAGYGFEVVPVIHPGSFVSPSAQIGAGTVILAGAVVNAAACLGENVIVNSGAIVEHDCVIGNHVHIASGARLASTVHVEEGAHIGLGASVRQSIRIGRNALVGAGAVVIAEVAPSTVVVGVPARAMKRPPRRGHGDAMDIEEHDG